MKNKRKQRGKEKENVVFPVAEQLSSMPETYINFINNLKNTIKEVRLKTVLSAWQNIKIVQRTVAQIQWRSNITLLDKLKDYNLRLWYAIKTIENGACFRK